MFYRFQLKRDSGFQPPWKYNKVIKLDFENGEIVKNEDISNEMKIIRDKGGKKEWDIILITTLFYLAIIYVIVKFILYITK